MILDLFGETNMSLNKFIDSLKRNSEEGIFNPWFEIDPENDLNSECPQTRLSQLKSYLGERKKAKVILVAEALGYQGGHFSGIPMTSERILLGKLSHKGISPSHVFSGIIPKRTSNPIGHKVSQQVKENGFTEPTATVVWQQLVSQRLDTKKIVFWNAFPWHPYDHSKGILSNRTPTLPELEEGKIVLELLIDLFPYAEIIAVGNKAHGQLGKIGFTEVPKIRHPANGGASKFREQLLIHVHRQEF